MWCCRRTGYKWLGRFEREELSGLADQSGCPLKSPSRTEPALEQKVLGARAQKLAWDVRKISRYLLNRGKQTKAPAPTTVTSSLHRHKRIFSVGFG